MGTAGDHGLHGDLRYWPVPELVALDLPGGIGFVDALAGRLGHRRCRRSARPPPARRRARRCCSTPCARPGSWARTASSTRWPTASAVEEGDALVVATSGTSGQPKGVVLTHDAVAASAAGDLGPARRRPRPPRLAGLPAPGPHRRPVGRHAGDRHRDPPSSSCPDSTPRPSRGPAGPGGVTHVSLVATALRRLDPSVFTCILLGGSRAPGDLPPNVVATYGMTETGSGVVYDGWPLDGVEDRRSRPTRR